MQSKVTVLLSAAVLVAVSAFAQHPVPSGSEFRVNTYTTGGQYSPSVAHQPDGGFIVVWSSAGSDGPDPVGSIQGQMYDPNGFPAGGEFQINSYTPNYQSDAEIGTDAAGNFVVVWTGFSRTIASDWADIFGQRFAANGSPVGDELQINTTTSDTQWHPALAVAPGGEFLVAWDSVETSHADHRSGVVARRFAVDATPLGDEFQVNSYTPEKQRFPAVAVDADGDFVVVWESDGSYGTDSNPSNPSKSVQGQRFSAAGALLGGEFQVNTYTTNDQYGPSVAMDSNGDFQVVWTSYGSYGTDTNSSIQVQRYAADGTPLGGEFQVNSYVFGGQKYPQVTMASGGAFVVTWASTGGSGTDVNWSVQMRRLSADGMVLGQDFQVNSWTTGYQQHPAVSTTPSKEIAVVWQGGYDDPVKYYEYGIWGQRFDEDLLFASGLEFGDTSGWSTTVP